jgi:pyruvate/2-oxoglutarate dehydrogenase complex dihydrolipoamide dehydrogenase (E3) component
VKADLVVIGAGSGGLSVAAGAAQLGLKVVLYEKGEMGGDCLNYGCVPSKALIAAGKRAHALRTAEKFGVASVAPNVDWAAVKAHVKGVIAAIAPMDSVERFEGFGVRVVREAARFVGPDVVESASGRVRFRRAVIATGGRAALPPIPGLAEATYLTNETIFDVDVLPHHLVILGGGPIGLELGQAFARLGSKVTVIEAAQPLAGADPECAEVALARVAADGVEILTGAPATRVEGLSVEAGGRRIEGSHLLVALGRKPSVEGLGLEAAGVRHSANGVETDPLLRTSNRRIFAIGDVRGAPLFTHAAGWHASAFVRTALFKAATRADALPLPAVTYLDPEVAQIGLSEAEARSRFGEKAKSVRWAYHENDRAQAERETDGFAKLIVGPGGRILGAAIVGEGAGEAIQMVGLAMSNGLKARALTNFISPYPTRTEVIKRAAGAYFTPTLFSPKVRRLVALLQRLP